MHSRHPRRDFLHCAAAGAASLGFSPLCKLKAARAIEPIQRGGKPFFKFSMAAYSYRDLLASKPPKLSLEDFVADCAKLQLEGTELTSYYFPAKITPEYLRSLKQHCFKLGLDVSGTAVGNDFCHPAGEKRAAEIAGVKQWIDYAEILGAPVIRIFSGQPHGTSVAEAHSLAVAGIEECCQYAGEHGVFLALENHGGLTTTPEGMLALVRDVRSPWFGVNLDTGNFHGADLYADLAKLAPYAINVQIKVTVSGPDGKGQRADFSRLAQIMTDAGYRGYIVLEFEDPGEPRAACARYVEQLRAAFKA
jgi:sugar phosphate isomerase/epimerase